MAEWISVKEAVPPPVFGDVTDPVCSEDVLTWWSDESVIVAFYDHPTNQWISPDIGPLHGDCTHWMPLKDLPEPPK